ncbi:MAG: hypothetical protein RMI89_10800 [Gloeomargarita sp. SKYBB_i_bin120]|nr:hypothetical protein [Gloeomargarita sp. SKYG98]MCS7293438.1 hypothetical protein [Gloeomargarita sp. SKYB120]MDW8179004.1 hypothetical protein [Gloeomargarita sp. SKYBB_i_bin120]
MLTLHVPDGTLRVALTRDVARELLEQLQALRQSWRQAIPPPRPELNFVHCDTVRLEFFCNPNVWPHPFAAQVLVTVCHPQVQVSTQIGLPQLLADVSAFVADQ